MDPRAFEEWVRAEVSRKIKEGLYPPELLKETEADQLRDRVDASRDAAELSLEPPMVSGRPLLGRLVMLYKLLVARALRWYTRWMVSQIQAFGASVASALEVMEERLRDHEKRLERLSSQVALGSARAGDRHLPSHVEPARSLPGLPANVHLSTWRYRLYLDNPCLDNAPTSNRRVLVLDCEGGELLHLLRGAGADCYGVEADAQAATAARRKGLDVRNEDPLEHLRSRPPGSLSFIFTGSLVDRLAPDGVEELVRACALALVGGGVLVAETALESLFEPHRTFRPAERVSLSSLSFAAQALGFRDVKLVEFGAGPHTRRLIPAPSTADPILSEVVNVLNADLRIIDETLFGPRRIAVVARR